jgi:altronate dehydratase
MQPNKTVEHMMQLSFLVHNQADNVAVAVEDIAAGTEAQGRFRDQPGDMQFKVSDAVPLGHKFAIRSMHTGDDVIEYGVVIGRATSDIAVGQSVHVHNLKGKRWA